MTSRCLFAFITLFAVDYAAAEPPASNLCENATCEILPPNDRPRLGTAINWVKDPEVADRLARGHNQLVFEMHLSGNFENEGFT